MDVLDTSAGTEILGVTADRECGIVACSGLGKTAAKATFTAWKLIFSLCPMEPLATLYFTGQKVPVSVGSGSSKERGWCCGMVAVSDHPQGLTNHLAKRGASCYLQKGFVEKALNPEEEVWIPEQSARSRVQLHVQG